MESLSQNVQDFLQEKLYTQKWYTQIFVVEKTEVDTLSLEKVSHISVIWHISVIFDGGQRRVGCGECGEEGTEQSATRVRKCRAGQGSKGSESGIESGGVGLGVGVEEVELKNFHRNFTRSSQKVHAFLNLILVSVRNSL
jgi:hypothetical protein